MPEPSDANGLESDSSGLAWELGAIPFEPLLSVEKALIVGSLSLGLVLLGVLLWASAAFFPISGPVTKG